MFETCFADYFKETDSEGKDAVHSAIQRLQRDPDRDVRYFAGVEEDALDLTYEAHSTSLHTAQQHFQDISYDPEEELELENETSEDSENRAEDVNEIYSDSVESRTETLDSAQQVPDFDQPFLEESLSTDALVETNLESTTQEFEENERRLDLESEDDSHNQVETTGEESDEAPIGTEETMTQRSNEVTLL